MSDNIKKGLLKVAFMQTDIVWEDPSANFLIIEQELDKITGKIDLVVLPETFTTGFSMNVGKNADSKRSTERWMIMMSDKFGCSITGTTIVEEDGAFFNRHYFIGRGGKSAYYDKRHLFGIGGERESFTKGRSRVVVGIGEFRILLQTCYDLRFPVFSRYKGDYDAIIYSANWPSRRQYVWDSLLVARAIENQAYIIGITRSGSDGEGVDYTGGSCLVHPDGKVLARMDENPGCIVQTLDIREVRELRESFPVLQDADNFTIEGVELK